MTVPQCYITVTLPILFDVLIMKKLCWMSWFLSFSWHDTVVFNLVKHGLVRWSVELFVCWERCKSALSVLHRDSDCDELSGNIILSLAFILLCSMYKYERLLKNELTFCAYPSCIRHLWVRYTPWLSTSYCLWFTNSYQMLCLPLHCLQLYIWFPEWGWWIL